MKRLSFYKRGQSIRSQTVPNEDSHFFRSAVDRPQKIRLCNVRRYHVHRLVDRDQRYAIGPYAACYYEQGISTTLLDETGMKDAKLAKLGRMIPQRQKERRNA